MLRLHTLPKFTERLHGEETKIKRDVVWTNKHEHLFKSASLFHYKKNPTLVCFTGNLGFSFLSNESHLKHHFITC